MGDNVSTYEPVICGVPQGSVLGPLLFLLLLNDCPNVMSKCEIIKYADDTVIFFSHKNIGTIKETLNEEFTCFCSWLEQNELLIYFKKNKTEFMLFGTSAKLKMLSDNAIGINYNFTRVSQTDSYTYLGLNIKNNLNTNEYLRSSLKKAATRLKILRRIRYIVDTNTASTIYKSLILPLLTYCPLLTLETSETMRSSIQSFEKRARRVVATDSLPEVDKVKRNRVCTFVYKIINNLACENFDNYFDVFHGNRTRIINTYP